MNTIIEKELEFLVLGDAQTRGRAALVPLLRPEPANGPEYLMLSEALQQGLLRVTEVSEGGAVPELKVTNEAGFPVLILDGEELAGAKQNRVVNTTILLREKSETVIPVSCTERGRWAYRSPVFHDSEAVMARDARGKKSRSVHESLKRSGFHRSYQGEVCAEVDRLHEHLRVCSPTAAMRDAYEARRDTLSTWAGAFPLLDGQTGLVFLLDGKPAGLEFLSHPRAYRLAHDRLIKSYTIDLDPDEPAKPAVRASAGDPAGELAAPDSAARAAAAAFRASLAALSENVYPSCGYGDDHRFESESICGSVLVHQDACVHAAFFQDTAAAEHHRPGPRMASYQERLRHRRQRGDS